MLNGREKDEGDLFGVRAIEAGFFGGVAQSRPSSLAGTPNTSRPGTPSMSSNTLIGSLASPAMKASTPSGSVTSLPLVRTHSAITLDAASPAKPRKVSSALSLHGGGLQPSQAELNGRTNHSTTVDMNLIVPPSPVHSERPRSTSPSPNSETSRAASPHSPTFLGVPGATVGTAHYAPSSPPASRPESVERTVHAVSVSENRVGSTRSCEAYFESGRGDSRNNSRSPSPPEQYELPTMPSRAARSASPQSFAPRGDSLNRSAAGEREHKGKGSGGS